jgi:surface antigen/LysM repeat protein
MSVALPKNPKNDKMKPVQSRREHIRISSRRRRMLMAPQVSQQKHGERRPLKRLFSITRKKVVGYGLLSVNIALVLFIGGFIAKNRTPQGQTTKRTLNANNAQAALNPLDQVSSADIAVYVAKLTKLPEETSVTNHADSVNAQLTIVPSDNRIIAKPQIVGTTLKSRKDIRKYVVVNGDTMSTVATKFGVTSDSIKWSNGINGDLLTVGKELWIPPTDGIVYVVKSGDTIDTLADKYHASKDLLVAYNDFDAAPMKNGEQILIPGGSIRPVFSAVPIGYSPSPYTGAFNGYDYGWCTWYVANRRIAIGHPLPTNLGDAWTWAARAGYAGIPVGDVPSYGAAMMMKSGYPGHVAFVEEVLADGSIWVSDMNYFGQRSKTDATPAGGWNRVSWRHLGPAEYSRYKFIYW